MQLLKIGALENLLSKTFRWFQFCVLVSTSVPFSFNVSVFPKIEYYTVSGYLCSRNLWFFTTVISSKPQFCILLLKAYIIGQEEFASDADNKSLLINCILFD